MTPRSGRRLRTQWMPPAQSLETREIAVRCDEFTAMFDRQRGHISISYQRPLNPIAEFQKKIPVCATWHYEYGSGPFNEPPAKCQGRWHRCCWPDDLWIGNESQEAGEHNSATAKGLGAPTSPLGQKAFRWRSGASYRCAQMRTLTSGSCMVKAAALNDRYRQPPSARRSYSYSAV